MRIAIFLVTLEGQTLRIAERLAGRAVVERISGTKDTFGESMRTTIVALGFALTSWSCAHVSRPIVLEASPADLETLAGEWSGDYVSNGRARGGSILFALAPGEDHAHGDVVMIPEGSARSYQPDASWRTQEAGRAASVLTIHFVRVAGHDVGGAIEAYWDPDRRCTASATFRGRLDSDRITGTFTSTCEGGETPMTGRWSVTRTSHGR